MSLRDEIIAIESEISSVLVGITFYRQNMPITHKAHEITIEALSSELKTETAYHSRRARVYRICYFGTSEIEVMSTMEQLEALLLEKIKIPVNDNQYLSVTGFSFSQGFETETDGVFCAIGILNASTNEARKQNEYSKVQKVYFEKN